MNVEPLNICLPLFCPNDLVHDSRQPRPFRRCAPAMRIIFGEAIRIGRSTRVAIAVLISGLSAQISSHDLWLSAVPASLFLYYLIAWFAIGREPEPGPLVTRYAPPAGLSAAAVRYMTTTGSDGRSLAAVIAQLAVCGCVRVEPQDGKYKISRLLGDRRIAAAFAPEEQRVLAMLFEDGPVIEMTPSLDQRNTAQQGRYVFHIQQELTKRFKGKYFTRHAGVIALGVLATFAAGIVLAAALSPREAVGAAFFSAWILFVGLTLGLIVQLSFVDAWKNAARAGTSWLKLLPGSAAITVFGVVIAYLLKNLAHMVSPAFAIALVALMAINFGWAPALKRTTPEGRQILDEIASFRLFLEKVEQDRLDKLNPADEILQAREQFLAYAIALEVKEAWGDHLAQTFFATTTMR
jgi:hypothetical protein